MKTTVILSILIVSAIILASCSNDDGEEGAGLTLVKTIPGGCNNMKFGEMKSAPAENCYCKCMCYYTWKFLFAGFSGEKKQGYAFILDDPRQKEPVVIMKGPVKL